MPGTSFKIADTGNDRAFVDFIPVKDNIIDMAVRYGAKERKSREIIYYIFTHCADALYRTDILRRAAKGLCFGIIVDGEKYTVEYGENGMRIALGQSVKAGTIHKTSFSYADIEKRIYRLIREGTYIPAETAENSRKFFMEEMKTSVGQAVGDISDNELKGEYPFKGERYSYKNANTLEKEEDYKAFSDYVHKVCGLLWNKRLFRFPGYVGRTFKKAREILDNTSFESIISPEPVKEDPLSCKYFISDDEITTYIKIGACVSGHKMRTYSGFTRISEKKERVKFLSNEYGVGGQTHVNRDAHLEVMHDSKGIVLTRRGDDFSEEKAKAVIPWTKATEIIDTLIKDNEFLSEEEVDAIDGYEKSVMAKRVIWFYRRAEWICGRNPRVILETDLHIKEEDVVEFVKEYFNDKDTLKAFDTEMHEIFKGNEESFKDYDKETLEIFHNYVNGTFTLFPQKDKLQKKGKKPEKHATADIVKICDFENMEATQMSIFDFIV